MVAHAPGVGHSCEDAAVGAGGISVEGERVERGFGALDAVLAAAAFGRVVGGVWAGCEFGEGDRGDGDLDRKGGRWDGLEVDDDRCQLASASRRGHAVAASRLSKFIAMVMSLC